MEEPLEEMFPKKGNVCVAKCPGRVELIAIDLIPAFFAADGGPLIPTLRLLHQFPDMLPRMVRSRSCCRVASLQCWQQMLPYSNEVLVEPLHVC